MLEKFSLESQKIIASAESLSYDLSHASIGCEHLLLSILKSPDVLLTIELKKYRVTFKNVLNEIKDLFHTPPGDLFFMEYTLELKKLLENAIYDSKEYREEKVSLNTLCITFIKHLEGICNDIFEKYEVDKKIVMATLIKNHKKCSDLDRVIDLHNLKDVRKDPLIGRKAELKQLINTLKRRNKPNALIIGAPGIGKTAIVEELAFLLSKNEIKGLENKRIYELDMSSVVGGTKYRGEFEEKLKKIIKLVKEDRDAILFIDEIHNIIKAGGAEGAIDASNIFKPYLSRGEIQIIGATTTDEYHQTIEKDKALNRRFQIIKIDPSTKSETKEILQSLRPIYEDHYKITISSDLMNYIVDLADEYIPNQAFPDKAIDILDNSCVDATGELTINDINTIVESYYNVSISNVSRAMRVRKKLEENIFGQEEVINKVYRGLLRIEKGLVHRDKPLLTMFFVGPSGVGKTETAKIIAKEFVNNDQALIKLDMAQYQESVSLNKLIGSAPGYVGYNESPSFVKRMKMHPHCVVLLDEIEKAHLDVSDFFLNIFDEGYFTDAHGERVNCTNAIFILTSNIGFDLENITKKRYSVANGEKNVEQDIYKLLSRHFRLEFLNRIDDIVPFKYLDSRVHLMMVNKIKQDFINNYNFEQSSILEDVVIEVDNAQFERFGVRYIKRMIADKLSEYIEESDKIKK